MRIYRGNKKGRFKEPRVISHFPSLSEYDIDANAHMFTEDVHLAVMPIGGKTEKHSEFNIKLEGSDKDFERALELCRSLAQYEPYDIVEVICDAVDRVTLHWHGMGMQSMRLSVTMRIAASIICTVLPASVFIESQDILFNWYRKGLRVF